MQYKISIADKARFVDHVLLDIYDVSQWALVIRYQKLEVQWYSTDKRSTVFMKTCIFFVCFTNLGETSTSQLI